jgi:hypothetical protein
MLLVKHLLREIGLKQSKLGRAADVPLNQVCILVNGKGATYPKARRNIADVLRREVPIGVAESLGWDGTEAALYRQVGDPR